MLTRTVKASLAALAVALTLGTAPAECAPPRVPAKPAQQVNFGFPIGFSVTKMDRSADPRRDFKRYAAGRWLDRATIPSDATRVSCIDALIKRTEQQVQIVIADAAKTSGKAPKGSPRQQVGDFYLSGMDVKRLEKLGLSPLKPELARIEKLQGTTGLAPLLAHLDTVTNDAVMMGFGVMTDPKNPMRYVVGVADGPLGMGLDNYTDPKAQPIRDAYKKYIADTLTLAGSKPAEAQAAAARILELETRIAAKKLTPLQKLDPDLVYRRTSWADLQAAASNFDVDGYIRALGLAPQAEVIVTDLDALRERNAIVGELSAADLRIWLRWGLLKRMSDYLSPAFARPNQAFSRVLYGTVDEPSRAKFVSGQLPTVLGHPLSRLYVARYFSAASKRVVEEMVARIRAEFRARLVRNGWLSPETKRSALQKIDKAKITVGYPSHWIDYASVDIRRDDYMGNVIRINRFRVVRDLKKFGKPVNEDEFAVPTFTLPITINAAYQRSKNSIEIPAAFLQPPFYDPKADPAVNFGAMGAVIGHEITHGFDSSGRLFDARGMQRNWWTDTDDKRFTAEAMKIVRQADRWQILPGLPLNGKLEVTENLADVGGVALGYGALQRYLHDHPQADRTIDGFTQRQRYFLAWAQMWADKSREGYLRQTIPTDSHPPGVYRLISPNQHDAAFFKAFGIRPGDPMWLDVKDRVIIW